VDGGHGSGGKVTEPEVRMVTTAKPVKRLHVSAPGRVCLFGEHQDYLGLPVIPCAISLRISIEGSRRSDSFVNLNLPDIKSHEGFSIEESHSYVRERDYYRSAMNVLKRKGFTFSTGFDCEVRSTIPINAGTSSSSALIVAWVNFLTQMSDRGSRLSPAEIARYAHEAEVLEFKEPGGMMDHYSTAFGGILALDFHPEVRVEPIEADVKSFVLGDSGEPKDTKYVLAYVKNQVIEIVQRLSAKHANFSLHTATLETLHELRNELNEEQFALLVGTIRNRDITVEARKIFRQLPLDHRRIGALLTEHQAILRDVLKISTPKIDRMIEFALKEGAYGGKINGSGGGGCMFVYAPEEPERVAGALRRAGGTAYVVHPDEGVRNDDGVVKK